MVYSRKKANPADIIDLCKLAERVYKLAERDANGDAVETRLEGRCFLAWILAYHRNRYGRIETSDLGNGFSRGSIPLP